MLSRKAVDCISAVRLLLYSVGGNREQTEMKRNTHTTTNDESAHAACVLYYTFDMILLMYHLYP